MAHVVGLEQIDLALGFFLRNLTEHIFRKVMLEFTERSHPVVDAIEQNENCQSGKRTDAKSDQQTFDQTWSN